MLYLVPPAFLTLSVSRPHKHRGHVCEHVPVSSRPSISMSEVSSGSVPSSFTSFTSAKPGTLQRLPNGASLSSFGSFECSLTPNSSKTLAQNTRDELLALALLNADADVDRNETLFKRRKVARGEPSACFTVTSCRCCLGDEQFRSESYTISDTNV